MHANGCPCLLAAGGEWISAYQTEQKKRLRAVLSTSARETKSAGTVNPPANTREVSGALKKILDGFFLLKHCYVEDPSDLCVCNISGVGLRSVSIEIKSLGAPTLKAKAYFKINYHVHCLLFPYGRALQTSERKCSYCLKCGYSFLQYKEEDFALFDNVIYINAAENQLPLGESTSAVCTVALPIVLHKLTKVVELLPLITLSQYNIMFQRPSRLSQCSRSWNCHSTALWTSALNIKTSSDSRCADLL